MAILTPSQLQASNDSTYTTNGVGSITGAAARSFNTDFISSSITVSQTGSMSVASASRALFADSASVTGANLVTSGNANQSWHPTFTTNVADGTPQVLRGTVGNEIIYNPSSSRLTLNSGGITAPSFTGSLQGTASYALNGGSSAFPYTGSAIITGSLAVTGSISTTEIFTANTIQTDTIIGVTTSPLAIQPLVNTDVYFVTSGSGVSRFKTAIQVTGSSTMTGSLTINGVSIGGSNVAQNNIFGAQALLNNTTGTGNVAIGQLALSQNLNGAFNIAIGSNALQSNTSGSRNVAIGFGSAISSTSGSRNTVIGNLALQELISGSYNTVIGASGAAGLTSGSFNTIIGAQTTVPAFTSNNIILADGAGNIKARYSGSWTLDGTVNTTASVAISSSYAATASYINPLNQTLELTGSLYVTGSSTLEGPLVISGGIDTTDYLNIGGYLAVTTDSYFVGQCNMYAKSIMQSEDHFPLVVSGTMQIDRIHFNGNPFNGNPGSNLGAIRFDQNMETFYTTNYNFDTNTTQSIVAQTVITASNYVETKLGADNAGQSYYLKLSNQSGTGSVTTNASLVVTASQDFYVHGHKQFNGGQFQNNTTLSGSAGVSQSIALPITDLSYGVYVANGSRVTVANAGVYNIQFSAQCESAAGADTLWIWFKKNGTNVTDSATKVVMPNNTAQTMTVNILVDAAEGDYYELAWQNLNGYGKILSEAASGNIPLIPAVIVTVTQVR